MTDEFRKIGFADIADVASTPSAGVLPIIVGGQAVNVWAIFYLPRVGNLLQLHAPFVSKDLDLYGPREILDDLSKRYGVPVTLSPPRFPAIGQVVISKGDKVLKVELLNNIRGISHPGTENAVDLRVEGIDLRVLDAISCLKAKIANAADLEQTDRQDVKHVKIMKICAREFVKDILARAEQKLDTERGVVDCLGDLQDTLRSANAQKANQKWGISFKDVMPMEAIQQSILPKVQNFSRYQLSPDAPRESLFPRQDPGGSGMRM
jgi:hypothetical protein